MAENDALPDYRIALDRTKTSVRVMFFSRNWRLLMEKLQSEGKERMKWFERLIATRNKS